MLVANCEFRPERNWPTMVASLDSGTLASIQAAARLAPAAVQSFRSRKVCSSSSESARFCQRRRALDWARRFSSWAA
jgi:hypothetical protein